MAGKIFFRERIKTKEGARTPRFRIAAVTGIDLKVYGNHFRKKELEQIGSETGAALVELKRDKHSKNAS